MKAGSWLSWSPKAPEWLDLRYLNGNAPTAPLSSQQAAGRMEVSVQEMVGVLGGYNIRELQDAVKSKWAFKFKITKIWRAADSLRDTGVYSYLDHHWLIIQLDDASSAADKGKDTLPSQKTQAAESCKLPGDAEPARVGARGAADQGVRADQPEEFGDLSCGVSPSHKRSADLTLEGKPGKRSSGESSKAELAAAPNTASRVAPEDDADNEVIKLLESSQDEEAQHETAAGTQSRHQNHVSSGVDESDWACIDSQEAMLKPQEDHGMDLANAGRRWFLRIDRFDEADKWFACADIENALRTEQAREKCYLPRRQLLLEVAPGSQPLYLDCLVPLLVRVSDVKYSVFAKGTHCQWHAKVVSCLAASMCEFLDPAAVPEGQKTAVSPILMDGTEQSKFSDVAKQLTEPGANAFLRQRPEALFLKPCHQVLKELIAAHPGKFPLRRDLRPFPDVSFIYAALKGNQGPTGLSSTQQSAGMLLKQQNL